MLLRADESAVVQTQFDCMHVSGVDCRVQGHVSLRVQHGPLDGDGQDPAHPVIHVAEYSHERPFRAAQRLS